MAMKCALIGLGMVSRTYGAALEASQLVDLSLIYARSEQSCAAFIADWPSLGVEVATSLADIAASDVDFVIVTTPPNARLEIVEILSAAGKPILMEKPVERTAGAAEKLVQLCQMRDVPLGIMLQHRARPIVSVLQKLRPDLGPLHMAEVAVPWWRDQSYYDVPGRGSYARDGGGVLISQAIHTLDLLLSLTGRVSSVSALSATTRFHKMEAEDFVSAGLQFETGAVAHLFATTASYPGRGETITLHCAHGSAHLEAGELQVFWQDGRKDSFGTAATSGAGADPMAFTSDWHQMVIDDFAEALTTGRKPLVTGVDALQVHRLIEAIEQASKTGQTVLC